MEAVHLEQISQIAITVRDLARSRKFYEEVLGLKFLFDAGTMVFFQCGTVRLMIGSAEVGKPFVAAGTILYFKVADIDATHRILAEQGVSFIQPPHHVAKMPDHDLWMAFFTDPDENTLVLMSEVRFAA